MLWELTFEAVVLISRVDILFATVLHGSSVAAGRSLHVATLGALLSELCFALGLTATLDCLKLPILTSKPGRGVGCIFATGDPRFARRRASGFSQCKRWGLVIVVGTI